MNQVFTQSEFLPSHATSYFSPYECYYYGIIKGYAVLHYCYISDGAYQIMEYGSNTSNHKLTPCLAYSLEDKKFYTVMYLYEQNVFDDKDMDQIAPYGYVKKVHVNEEKLTYEVYVNKLEDAYKQAVYGRPDLDGTQYFWAYNKYYYGIFYNYVGVDDKEYEEKLNEDFNHKRTCFVDEKFAGGIAQTYLISKNLEANQSVYIEYYRVHQRGTFFLSVWAENEELPQERYEMTSENGFTYINDEGHPLYRYGYPTYYWWI